LVIPTTPLVATVGIKEDYFSLDGEDSHSNISYNILSSIGSYRGGDPNLTDFLFLANTIRALSTTIDGASGDIIASKNTTIFRVYRQNRLPELTW